MKKIDQLYTKTRTFVHSKSLLRELKDKPEWEKYFQYKHPPPTTKSYDLYPDYIQNFYKSIRNGLKNQ